MSFDVPFIWPNGNPTGGGSVARLALGTFTQNATNLRSFDSTASNPQVSQWSIGDATTNRPEDATKKYPVRVTGYQTLRHKITQDPPTGQPTPHHTEFHNWAASDVAQWTDGKDYWGGFSFYLPSGQGFEGLSGTDWVLIYQHHNEGSTSPSFAIEIRASRIDFVKRPPNGGGKRVNVPRDFDVWHNVIWHRITSLSNSTGLLDVYHSTGTSSPTLVGHWAEANLYSSTDRPYIQMGYYSYTSGKTPFTFYRHMPVVDRCASRAVVESLLFGSAPPPPATAPTVATSFSMSGSGLALSGSIALPTDSNRTGVRAVAFPRAITGTDSYDTSDAVALLTENGTTGTRTFSGVSVPAGTWYGKVWTIGAGGSTGLVSSPTSLTLSAPPPPSLTVTVSPSSASLANDATQVFTAAVTGTATDKTVTWKVNGVTGGDSTNGTIVKGGITQTQAGYDAGPFVSATSWNVSGPTSMTAGDLVVMVIATQELVTGTAAGYTTGSPIDQSAGASTLPSTTLLPSTAILPSPASGEQLRTKVYTYRATGTESGGFTFSFTGPASGMAAWSVYRNVDTSTPIDIGTVGGVLASSTSWTLPSLTPNTSGAYVVGIITSNPASTGKTATWSTGTERVDHADADTGSGSWITIADKVWNAGDAAVALAGSSGASDQMAYISTALRPASIGGIYTAPHSTPTPATVNVQAVANADGTTTGTSVVTIGGGTAPITVSVSPSAAAVAINATAQFTATIHNGTGGVTWSVVGGSTKGTITSGGLYTAPSSVPSPATVTVRATSVSDGTKTADATVTVSATAVGGLTYRERTMVGTAGAAPDSGLWRVVQTNQGIGGSVTLDGVETAIINSQSLDGTAARVVVESLDNLSCDFPDGDSERFTLWECTVPSSACTVDAYLLGNPSVDNPISSPDWARVTVDFRVSPPVAKLERRESSGVPVTMLTDTWPAAVTAGDPLVLQLLVNQTTMAGSWKVGNTARTLVPASPTHNLANSADLASMRASLVVYNATTTSARVLFVRNKHARKRPYTPTGGAATFLKHDGSTWVSGVDAVATLYQTQITGTFTSPDDSMPTTYGATAGSQSASSDTLPVTFFPGPTGTVSAALWAENESADV